MNTATRMFKKNEEDMAIKRSVSMPKRMFNRAAEIASNRGFATFSDYLQDLMRRDHAGVSSN